MPGISLGIIILSNFIQPEGEDNPSGKLRPGKSEDLPSYNIQGPTQLWTSVPCFLPLSEFELLFSQFFIQRHPFFYTFLLRSTPYILLKSIFIKALPVQIH